MILVHVSESFQLHLINILANLYSILGMRIPVRVVFNQLNDKFLKTHYRYAQLVKVPTRGQSTLDKIWTNMSPVYDTPITLSELGSSDHNMVLLRSTHGHSLVKGSTVRVTIRCMSSDNRAKFSAMLSAVRWETMFIIRALVRKRQRAHMCGDLAQARLFRNKVNRAAVRLRKEFYQAKAGFPWSVF